MIRRKVLTKRLLIALICTLIGIYCFLFFNNADSKSSTYLSYGERFDGKCMMLQIAYKFVFQCVCVCG